jgi:type II secretory pathway pseudopilin PulG
MRVLAVGGVIALFMIPVTAAFAQNPLQESINKQKKDAAAEAERAYQKALRDTRSHAPTAKPDPWGNVRAADPKQGQQSK